MVHEQTPIPREEAALRITSGLKSNLQGIAKWALILSIIGFIVISLVLLVATFNSIYLGLLRDNQPGGQVSPLITGLSYLIIGGLVLVPVFTFYQFGIFLKKALSKGDQVAMDKAFANLKTGLRYSGWAVIGGLVYLGLAIYVFPVF